MTCILVVLGVITTAATVPAARLWHGLAPKAVAVA